LEEAPPWQQPWLQDLLRSAAVPAALAFTALLIVLALIRPAMKALLAPPPPPAPGSRIDALIDDANSLPGAAQAALALEAPKANVKLEGVRALARQNPAAVAHIVRTLINDEKATA